MMINITIIMVVWQIIRSERSLSNKVEKEGQGEDDDLCDSAGTKHETMGEL